MLRNALVLAVCCLVFAVGCEKKEGQQAPPRSKGSAAKAPAGMVVLGEKPLVFLTKSPVTVAQYVQYLRESGQPVPEGMRAVALGGPGGDQPVSGLTHQEAQRYATWNLMRLPTQQEWAMASLYVAPTPYAWAGPDENTPVVAPVYLVQDWLPGSAGEQKATAAKQALAQELEKARAAGFEQARKALADLVAAQKAAAQQRWDQFKPAFFGLVDKQKQLAELNGQKSARQDVLKILQNVATEKGKLAAKLKLGEGDAQAATKTYTDQLAQWRTEVQATRQTLEDRTKALQQQVVEQTGAFDDLGTKSITDRFAEAEALLQQSAQAPAQPKDAAALQAKLVDAAQKLQDAPALFESLPDPASLSQQAAKVQEQMGAAGADKATLDQIAQMEDHIQNFGQSIGQDFLDEKLLLQDLDTLVDLGSRHDAVQANLAALTGVMRQLSTPETTSKTTPPTTPATTPPAAPQTPAR
jgi:hypothetical protein